MLFSMTAGGLYQLEADKYIDRTLDKVFRPLGIDRPDLGVPLVAAGIAGMAFRFPMARE